MGEQADNGVRTYEVTRPFIAADGKTRVPKDALRGTVDADYATAARLRKAGCIGGIVAKSANIEMLPDSKAEEKKKKAEEKKKKAEEKKKKAEEKAARIAEKIATKAAAE